MGVAWTSISGKDSPYKNSIKDAAGLFPEDPKVKVGKKTFVQPLSDKDIDILDPANPKHQKDIVKMMLFFAANPPKKNDVSFKAYNRLKDKLKEWSSNAKDSSPEKVTYKYVVDQLTKFSNDDSTAEDYVALKNEKYVKSEKDAASKALVALGITVEIPKVTTDDKVIIKEDTTNSIKGDSNSAVANSPIDQTNWATMTKTLAKDDAALKELNELLAKGVKKNDPALRAILVKMGWHEAFINIVDSDKGLFKGNKTTINATQFQQFCKDEIGNFRKNRDDGIAGYENYDKTLELYEYPQFIIIDTADEATLKKANEAMDKDKSFNDSTFAKGKEFKSTLDRIKAYVQYKGTDNLPKTCYSNPIYLFKDGKLTTEVDTRTKLIKVVEFTAMVLGEAQKTDSASAESTENVEKMSDDDFKKLEDELFPADSKLKKELTQNNFALYAKNATEWMQQVEKRKDVIKDSASESSDYAIRLLHLISRIKDSKSFKFVSEAEKQAFCDAFNKAFDVADKNAVVSSDKKTTLEGYMKSVTGLGAKGLKFKEGKLQSTTVARTDAPSGKGVKTEAQYEGEGWIPCKRSAATTTKTNFYLDPNDSKKTLNYYVNGSMKISGKYKLNAENEVVKIKQTDGENSATQVKYVAATAGKTSFYIHNEKVYSFNDRTKKYIFQKSYKAYNGGAYKIIVEKEESATVEGKMVEKKYIKVGDEKVPV